MQHRADLCDGPSRAKWEYSSLLEAGAAEPAGDRIDLIDASTIMPGDARCERLSFAFDEEAGLAHSGDADRGYGRPWHLRESVGDRCDHCLFENFGADLPPGLHLDPGRRSLAEGNHLARGLQNECLACSRSDVDAEKQLHHRSFGMMSRRTLARARVRLVGRLDVR